MKKPNNLIYANVAFGVIIRQIDFVNYIWVATFVLPSKMNTIYYLNLLKDME